MDTFRRADLCTIGQSYIAGGVTPNSAGSEIGIVNDCAGAAKATSGKQRQRMLPAIFVVVDVTDSPQHRWRSLAGNNSLAALPRGCRFGEVWMIALPSGITRDCVLEEWPAE